MKRAVVRMRILGSYLLLLAFAGAALLILSGMGIVDTKGMAIGDVSGGVEISVMVILGVWCMTASKASWYAAISYFLTSFAYRAVSLEALHGFWSSGEEFQIGMLALYAGFMTWALSSRVMISGIELEKGVAWIHLVSLALILLGLFFLVSYFSHALIAVFLVMILAPVLAKRNYGSTVA